VAFLEGEGPSKRSSSRSSVALPPLFPTGVSSREGERPIEGGVRETRTGRPCNSGLDPKAIEPIEDPEGPNFSIRIGSFRVGIFS
jgi:hypothetical protein